MEKLVFYIKKIYRKLVPRVRIRRKRKEYISLGSQVQIDKSVNIGPGAFITARKGGFISIASGTSLNIDVMLNADLGGQIIIGKDCLIGPRVVFRTANHIYADRNKPIKTQGHTFKDIILENDIWIGANSVILSGVKIGQGSIVGAGSVVTGDVAPFSVVGGVPARKIKNR